MYQISYNLNTYQKNTIEISSIAQQQQKKNERLHLFYIFFEGIDDSWTKFLNYLLQKKKVLNYFLK